MIKTSMKIDGMMCGISRSKKEASFLAEEAVDADSLKAAINATGYTCLGIESAPYEKKGLFGRK